MPSLRTFGCYLPPTILTNEELASRLHVSPEWIREVSGIEQRRVAMDETAAALAVKAGADCLSRAGVSASAIGAVIVSCASAQDRFPGPAAFVAKELGFAGLPAFDVPVASAGSLFGLVLAAELSGRYGPVLVIAAEKMTAFAHREPLNKNLAILFGDGAGACLVHPGKAGLEIRQHSLRSDGSFHDDLSLDKDGILHMNGLAVILQAARKVPAAINEVLSAAAIPLAGVKTFLMHQANLNLIDRVAKGIRVEPKRFFSNIQRYGNTSSASLLIAAAEWREAAALSPGDAVCLAAFGAGFHWGALVAVEV